MNGRYFAGEAIQAYIHDGREKFTKKKELLLGEEDEEDDEERRLEEYAQWLENQ